MSKKEFTYRSTQGYWNEKYPIISEVTSNKYLVKIKPYQEDDTQYKRGCIVSLCEKGMLFTHVLQTSQFANDDGKIKIQYWSRKDQITDWDYNLIDMTKLIVNLYETSNKLNDESKLTLEKDFEELKNWNGLV
jgi:hypothetical protein